MGCGGGGGAFSTSSSLLEAFSPVSIPMSGVDEKMVDFFLKRETKNLFKFGLWEEGRK